MHIVLSGNFARVQPHVCYFVQLSSKTAKITSQSRCKYQETFKNNFEYEEARKSHKKQRSKYTMRRCFPLLLVSNWSVKKYCNLFADFDN